MSNDTPDKNLDNQNSDENSKHNNDDASQEPNDATSEAMPSEPNPTSDQAASIDINIDDILDPVTTLQAERDDLKDQMLRAVAETENTRRRAERDVAQVRKYGHTGFARDLLSVVENLSRAVEVLPENRDGLDDTMKNLVIGVEMISKELASVLERHGIIRIMPIGEKFDPNKHQAMFEVPTNEAEPGTIVQVAQSGWMLHDRLLSPAMVGVAKAAENNATTDKHAADNNDESSA
ncbi:MAG: nucleotide exchange factor GrpE [Alphaproteobacteria bacterium]|nr:nucleotide exchange factor GrpE [Alphaproteobacteria bacterium]